MIGPPPPNPIFADINLRVCSCQDSTECDTRIIKYYCISYNLNNVYHQTHSIIAKVKIAMGVLKCERFFFFWFSQNIEK